MSEKRVQTWTKEELIEAAKRQKNIQWLVLANFIALLMPGATIVTGMIGIYCIYNMKEVLP